MLAASFPTGIGAGASETRPYQPATNLSIPFIPPHTAYPPSRLSSLTSCAHHLGKDSKGLIDTVDIDTVKRYRSLPKISYPGTPASRIAHPSRLGLGLSGASMGFDHMDEFNPADFTTTANFPTSIITSLHHQPIHKYLRRWESHFPPTPCEKNYPIFHSLHIRFHTRTKQPTSVTTPFSPSIPVSMTFMRHYQIRIPSYRPPIFNPPKSHILRSAHCYLSFGSTPLSIII